MNKLDIENYTDVTKEWLENAFGGEIYLLPRINKPDGIKTLTIYGMMSIGISSK